MTLQAARNTPDEEGPTIYLLEFDERFGVFDEFVFYDFHNPLKLPRELPLHVPDSRRQHLFDDSTHERIG